jgi:UDP-N-acetylglucosamine 2-epimerase (non-hydrolysing)
MTYSPYTASKAAGGYGLATCALFEFVVLGPRFVGRTPNMHILHVVGTRPNFMKAAPVLQALARQEGVRQTLVHTGQHYNFDMSDVFFQQLGMPAPDFNLEVGSGSHALQTSQIIARFEAIIVEHKPDWVVVYGDVNSTVAAAIVCAKMMIPVAHVEAGLRSFDRTMPEEINRLLTDQISELLFTPSEDGNRNLRMEGVAPEKVHLVGNVMIDTLIRLLPYAKERSPKGIADRYALVTLHRPSNVDDIGWLKVLLDMFREISHDFPVLFPVHPRTRGRMAEAGIELGNGSPNLQILDPAPYLEFLALQSRATVVITDSGGIQEETTFLGIPCLTVRENTERPITVAMGTNILVGRDIQRLRTELEAVLAGKAKRGIVPPLWDGHAAERIAQVIIL